MLRYTLKTLLAHKLRLVLSAVAVVIGVAMVSGTYVLTDTLGRTFDNLFSSVNRNTAVAIRGANAFDNANSDRPPIPAALLDRVRAVPGVRAAEPEIQAGNTMVVDPQTGQPLSNGGAPGLGVNYSDSTLSTLVVREGRGPHGPGEIAVDRATFRDAHLRLGEEATVLVSGKPARFRVVGVMTLGSSDNVGGATLTIFDTPTAQQLLLSPDRLTQISVAADSGVSQAELAARVRTVTGAGTDVVTGKQLAKESSDSIKQGLSFFNTFLLAFGFIALFVGAFIISNTFSMLIGQRVRELALLRALGAARKQVTRSVLGEALAVGVLGSTVGLGLGVLVAAGLKAVIAGVGVDIPSGSIVFLPRTVILGYAVGVLVTTASALLPALKASRVPPVAAMRDTFVLPARSLRVRAIVGSAVTLLGAAFMGLGLAGSGSSAAVAVGLGAALVFLGVAALSPLIAGPVIRVLGSPIRRGFGTVGVLSSANAQRNPRRTAATASALMIGLALVAGVTVLASSVKSSVGSVVRQGTGADFVLTGDNFTTRMSPALVADLTRQPGVATATGISSLQVELAGKKVDAIGADPRAVQQVISLRRTAGSLNGFGPDTLLVSQKVADANSWQVGQSVPVTFAEGGRITLRVAGVYAQNQLAGDYLLDQSVAARYSTNLLNDAVLVRSAPGASVDQLRTAVDATARTYPGIKVQDRAEFIASQEQQVNQLLGLVYVLLVLSVLIAAFGIVNTLALSVIERTREIGLLRAVGMSRRQLRRMVRLESVVIAVFGALLGLVIGSLFGWAVLQPLKDQGITEFSYPIGSMLAFVVVAGLLGVLAAVLPARRAAKLDVLRAIATT